MITVLSYWAVAFLKICTENGSNPLLLFGINLASKSIFVYRVLMENISVKYRQFPLVRRELLFILVLSARCVRRTNRRAIAIMFIRRSVCLSGTGVHCDHTVHCSADFPLRLDNPMSWPCLLYTSPSPRDRTRSRMPSSA